MAADFPQNLDDGERWLPPEIIPDVGRRRLYHGPGSIPFRRTDLVYIEDLEQQLAAFGLLDRSLARPVKPNPNYSGYPDVPFYNPEGVMASRPTGLRGPVLDRRLVTGVMYEGFRPPSAIRAGTGAYLPSAMPAQQLNPGKPVWTQLDGFPPVRGCRVPSHPNRLVPQVRLSGSGRECVGTGVFLPRLTLDSDSKKKSMKGTEKQRLPSRSNVAERRQSMSVPLQSPITDMGLPHEWTY